jgi:hypothetical protein
MDSTLKPSKELKDPKEGKVINGKRKRGISAWACAYKARNWSLHAFTKYCSYSLNTAKTKTNPSIMEN